MLFLWRRRAGSECQMEMPFGVAVDSAGDLFIADLYGGRIRKVSPDGFIRTLAVESTPHPAKREDAAYFRYYHRSRTHLGLGKQCPIERDVMNCGIIVEKPELGGLHHRYERVAA